MDSRVMLTGIEDREYLPSGFFRDSEAVLTAEEKQAASVKGWTFKGVEGGSDTIYTYRIAQDLAPKDFGEWAFRAVAIECSGATGRTWVNGQKGPMDADVTFTVVAVKALELTVIQADAKRRQEQAKTESEVYKQQRKTLEALEAKVKERLAKLQGGDAAKSK